MLIRRGASVWLGLLVCAGLAFGQATKAGAAKNPHGPLALACENCHTTTSWKPIRQQPEFDHNRETKYPLRGLHASVACTQCHLEKVFSNVGTQCADCHADIHRRQLGASCQECHTVRGWRVSVQSVREHRNRFPLLGAHASATCDACHKGAASGQFSGLNTACSSCHQSDFARTRAPDHRAAQLPQNCEGCHNTDRWQGARFDHAQYTRFPLQGTHAQLACTSCHTAGRFQGTPADCNGCHAADFARASNPNHVNAGFPRQCQSCHTQVTWRGARFEHNTATRFTLTGAHVQVSCGSCHVAARFAGTPQNCAGCHTADFERTTNPDHKRGNFSAQCENCHTTTTWQGAKFDHSISRFPLAGAHASVACAQCHVGGKYTGVTTDCYGCHRDAFQATRNPNHTSAGFSQNCTTCHSTTAWRGATFDHGQTRFALTGAHTTVTCAQCHVGEKYAGTSSDCAGCHTAQFNTATNPNHAAAGFPTNCTLCHTTTSWRGATYDHSRTRFPLTGAHASTTCSQCHVGGRYAGTATDCVGCHTAKFNATTNPNHVAAGFSTNCTLCHTTSTWSGATYDHNKTRFPLTGAHSTVACSQCHVGGRYAGTSMDCASCHITKFNSTTNPNHVAAGFPTNCLLCHTTQQWRGAVFDHNRTRFQLTGAHATTSCTQCHVGGRYAGTATDCVSCHTAQFNATTNPNHVAAGFGTNCLLCHTTQQWRGAVFDHSRTRFALTGAHTTTSCTQCHVGGRYAGTATDCASCHTAQFNAATSPNHAAAGFPTNCTLCHTTTSWRGATYDHSRTRFPLTGAHATTTCSQCHAGGRYAGTATDCASCHIARFNSTTSPNHVAAAFPTNCALCHTTSSWRGAAYDHNRTRFPLTGAHSTVACSQCHVGGRYAGTSTDCAACHTARFNSTTDPNHVAAGFPTNCLLCHTTQQWRGAVFDHNRTRFTLTGAHTTVTCALCHVGGRYAGTATDCASCHTAQFNATTNPNHVAAGFPTNCTLCHTTQQWRGAVFDHSRTRFVLTGAHSTTTCAQCHVGGRYTGTTTLCSGCHLALFNNPATVPNHTAAGFPTDCSACHTTIQWRGARFDHNAATRFPLTGAHVQVACGQCHVNNVFRGTATNCEGCHLRNFNQTTSPNHVAAGFPTTCQTCHTTTQWRGATFDHNTTRFRLTGAHLTRATCSQCHVGGRFAGTPMDCASCHTPAYNATRNPPHAAVRFPLDCSLCHTTTAWAGGRFDHSTTRFPLTGAHTSTTCTACHTGGRWTGLDPSCVACHRAKYDATTQPPHAAAGFPLTCQTCHSTSQWLGATFNHSLTRFPLTGRHTTTACTLCHLQGRYTGTPTDCNSCHNAVYRTTTNPNHIAAGFPTTCQTCHTTTQWTGATFNHAFPIYTGKHRKGIWTTCADCHVNASNYRVFECLGCHEHNKTKMDDTHRGISGYAYNSLTCYSCHPTGRKP